MASPNQNPINPIERLIRRNRELLAEAARARHDGADRKVGRRHADLFRERVTEPATFEERQQHVLLESAQRVRRTKRLVHDSALRMRRSARLSSHNPWLSVVPEYAVRVTTERAWAEWLGTARAQERVIREITSSLRGFAREVCIEAQEARWHAAQTRSQSAMLRARALDLKARYHGPAA